MTITPPPPDNQSTVITIRIFIVAAVLLIVGAMAAVWFSIPGPDTRHLLVSPSGTKSLDMAELCSPVGCNRVTVLDVTQPDGSHIRSGCPPQRAETVPLFHELTASWPADETSVTLDFTPKEGAPGQMTIALADCILTE